MFRIVQNRSRSAEQPPYFWLVCDNHNCGVSARADIPELDPNRVDDAASVAFGLFKEDAEARGWLYAVDRHLCPHCWKVVKELEVRRMQRLHEEMAQANAKQPPSLVQIGGTQAQIKAARDLEQHRRKVQEDLRSGAVPKASLQ